MKIWWVKRLSENEQRLWQSQATTVLGNPLKPSPPSSQKNFEKISIMTSSTGSSIYSPLLCNNIIKAAIFQYKILNNILYLNNTLFKMKVLQNPKCSICESSAETITHLFVECQFVSSLWRNVVNWCGKDIGLPLHLKANFLSWQKPLASQLRVLADNFSVLPAPQRVLAAWFKIVN